jgi:hypothetical protein
VKRREVIRVIAQEAKKQQAVWVIDHEGSRHTVYRLNEVMIPIPRHAELGRNLTRAIFIECETELGKGWWRS